MGGSLENFILARNFQSRSKSRIFGSLGPLGIFLPNRRLGGLVRAPPALPRKKQIVFQCRFGSFWELPAAHCRRDGRRFERTRKRRRAQEGGRITRKNGRNVDQRRRDDNKNKIFAFEGGGLGGREENPKTLVFVGNATTIKF